MTGSIWHCKDCHVPSPQVEIRVVNLKVPPFSFLSKFSFSMSPYRTRFEEHGDLGSGLGELFPRYV